MLSSGQAAQNGISPFCQRNDFLTIQQPYAMRRLLSVSGLLNENIGTAVTIELTMAIGVGIDGSCVLLCEGQWREAMTGTISLYDRRCTPAAGGMAGGRHPRLEEGQEQAAGRQHPLLPESSAPDVLQMPHRRAADCRRALT